MNIRFLVTASVLVLVVGAGLWGVWAFESGSAANGAADSGEFSYQLPQKASDGTDILLMCAEDVLAEPADAFSKWLKLDGIPLRMPGGALLLARLNDVTLDQSLKPAQRAAVEILKRHSPRRVVLVAHTNCIYYDTLAAWNNSVAGVRRRQIADMRTTMGVLHEWFPRADVSGYLAEEDGNHRLVFHSVDKLIP